MPRSCVVSRDEMMVLIPLVFAACLQAVAFGKSYNLATPIDLSHTVDEGTMTWVKDTSFQMTNRVAKNLSDTTFYAANDFCVPEHAGTHLDAPYHFDERGMKVADIPVDTLIGPGVLVNVSAIVNGTASDFLLLPEHLETWQRDYGEMPKDAIVLVDFGWSCKYHWNRTAYFGAESAPYSFPGISVSAAEWMVRSGRIRGIGVDTPSIDYGKSTLFSVHRIVYKAGLFGLENVDLCNKSLPARGFDVIALPMKIGPGTGAPVRIVAV